ncbi:ABC transporter ATP-binding protein [Dehalogenimonas alkenigignens]|uniref:ABC-type antimicrobial peptide transport system, ATPase component n=1 Tax=Dehalogenimonas alkenigignens TaxID=1217799 RepID=A0A0W0GH90_9CHLR|nr:ABC transporter ATP-binding protein [Dehalogenimonas alkenigignens]KTB47930.1 ABC-type antimicrobial peptide transport system, ATPase component [Dehalogenimonas alkenigignens]PVV82494.1 ABC transporter ATP-binding protein [Dehalogenimonas alkenigignens]
MLKLENVTKTFALDASTSISPVRDVTLDIKAGELIMIIGRSGTGKSTLLNLAAGLIKPTSGRVTMNGGDLAGLDDQGLSTMRRETMGFIFQFPSLIPSITVLDNVYLPSGFTSRKSPNHFLERSKALLETVGLSAKSQVHPQQLSAGEQKRVAIARALVNEPKLILADEPTSDLDQHTENQIMELICSINKQGVTFLVVTHSLELLPFASRAFEMEDGRLKPIPCRNTPVASIGVARELP